MVKRILPDDNKLIDLYVNEKKSCKEICRMYGLSIKSSSNIGYRLKNLGVQIRKDAGENHHNWKGGVISKGCGYIGIWQPSHPRADNQGYVYAHTLVYEKEKGILPSKNEVIHHIDMDKKNNSIENLYLCNHKQHIQIHRSLEYLVKELLDENIIKFQNGRYELISSKGVRNDRRKN